MKSLTFFFLLIWIISSCKEANQINHSQASLFNLNTEPDTLLLRLAATDFTDCELLNTELENVYQRDQYYRAKIYTEKNLGEFQRWSYRKNMSKYDPYNEKIVSYLLEEVGWSNQCGLSNKAHEAIWLTIDHSKNLEFKEKSLPYIHKAFKENILSPEIYAFLIDEIYVRIGRKQQYGMHPVNYPDGTKIYPERISLSIEKMNYNRELIGLPNLML